MDLSRILSDKSLAQAACRVPYAPETSFPILVAKIKLTWRCNLRCHFCHLWRIDPDPDRTLDLALLKKLLTSLRDQGLIKVHFSGGEVFLRPDFPEILNAACNLDLQINITTNGTLLNKEAARCLVDARVHTVAFSLDHVIEKKHDAWRGMAGAWKQTWKGINRLMERKAVKGTGPVVAVNTVVTRRNIDYLPELHDLLAERGIEKWRLLPLRTSYKKLRPLADQWMKLGAWMSAGHPLLGRELATWHTDKEARLAAKGQLAGGAMEQAVCFAPWFSLFVDADTRTFPCCTGRYKLPCYGSLKKSSLFELLSSQVRREILNSMAAGHEFGVCRTCDEFLAENQAFAQTITNGGKNDRRKNAGYAGHPAVE